MNRQLKTSAQSTLNIKLTWPFEFPDAVVFEVSFEFLTTSIHLFIKFRSAILLFLLS